MKKKRLKQRIEALEAEISALHSRVEHLEQLEHTTTRDGWFDIFCSPPRHPVPTAAWLGGEPEQ